MELQSKVDEIRARGLGLAVISYDSREVMVAFTKLHRITFPMLSDRGSATIKRFGLLNPLPEMALDAARKDNPDVKADTAKFVSVVNPRDTMTGMAFPGTFLLDRRGRVTARFFEDFYIERNTASSLMLKLGVDGGAVNGTEISSAHLSLRTYPSDASVAPGNRFSLVLEIKPADGIHVYAPGARNYRPISLKIEPQPFVRVLDVRYPAPEIYEFKPLKERVPVFRKPFRLLQEIVLEGAPAAQAAFRGKDSVTISGTLEYQACDAKECFNPVSVPLSWRLPLRDLVRTPTLQPKQ